MLEIIALLIGGGILLYFGAESLVRGSASLALRIGLTPLVVGLTVVAFGTSAPELVVSTKAALDGQGAIALGNVIGSNIFSIAVILGLAALIQPIHIKPQLLRFDAPIMVGVSLLCWLLFLDSRLSRGGAAVFAVGIVIYTCSTIIWARREKREISEHDLEEKKIFKKRYVALDTLFIVVGLALLVIGARMFVNGAISIAKHWGVSEAIIGLTIVAAGTSLPELVTSVVAALRKKDDIAVGNIIGSNVFNILGILGVAGLIKPLDAGGVTTVDFIVMIAIAMGLFILMKTKNIIARWEGVLLLLSYGGYLWWLWPR